MRLTLEGSVGTPEPGHAKDAGEDPEPRPGWSGQVLDFAAIRRRSSRLSLQERQGIRLDRRKVSSGAGAHRRSEGPGRRGRFRWNSGQTVWWESAVRQCLR